jgi:hypothetical protein
VAFDTDERVATPCPPKRSPTPWRRGVPAGVRLFIREDDPSNSVFSKLPVPPSALVPCKQLRYLLHR